MAVSAYDNILLSDAQKKQLEALSQAWTAANAAGDTAGMESAHTAAEAIRRQNGYQGGDAGDQYIPLEKETESGAYTPASLLGYQPQTGAVDRLYDAQQTATLQALESAYNQNRAAAEAALQALPDQYRAAMNETAANAARARQSYRETAATSGLGSGAGSQAALAQNLQLQGDLNTIRSQEQAATQDAYDRILGLETAYRDAVAQAQAESEQSRAEAMLAEYQKAAEAAVGVSQAQAQENYRGWESQFALSEAQREAQEAALERAEAAAQREAEAKKEAEEEARRAAEEAQEEARRAAETMAKYGDFSGYLALGYTAQQVAQMRRVWLAKNPKAAWAAY